MKKIYLLFCIILLSSLICLGCGKNQASNSTVTPTDKDTEAIASEPDSNKESQAEQPTDVAYSTKFNITINPEVELTTDSEGHVTEVIFLNEDAKTAYADLQLVGLTAAEATELIVQAATDKGFMTNGHPVKLTLVDTNRDGQETLSELSSIKESTQKVLTNNNFDSSVISGEIAKQEDIKEDTCDLCEGTGLLVCEDCNGTTFCNGLTVTVCGMCQGEGKTLCTLCEGNSGGTCETCGGTGGTADAPCLSCAGTGKITCSRCGDGNGYVTCYDCKGAGQLPGLPCPHCGGTLWGMCNRCNGSGVHEH